MSQKPFDDAFKDLAERDPEALLALLDILPPGATVTRLPREVSIQALLTDQPYEINTGAERYIEHVEAQAYWQGDEDKRAAGYSVRLWLKHELPVYTYILVFSRKGMPKEPPHSITLMAGGLTLTVQFRVIGLWQLSAAWALALQRESLLPFVPLMQGGATELEQCAEALCAITDDKRRSELALHFVLVGTLRYPKVDLLYLLGRMSMDLREFVRESEMYQSILSEGREEGREEGRRATLLKLMRKLTARRFPNLDLSAEAERIHDLDALENLCYEVDAYDDAAAWQRHVAELAVRATNGHAPTNSAAEQPLS